MDRPLGSYTDGPSCAAREKHIPNALTQQNSMLMGILEELGLLAKYLNPVLQPAIPPPPNEGKTLAGVRETMPPVAETLNEHNNILRTVLSELRDINSRIEV